MQAGQCARFADRATCGTSSEFVAIPDSFISGGVPDADMVLFVASVPTDPDTNAWALACQTDKFGRPVAGIINFNLNNVDVSDQTWDRQLRTAVHETMHALGFSSNSFNKFIDRRTGKRYSADVPAQGQDIPGVTQSVTTRGHRVSYFVLPTAVAEARDHFNCPTLRGLEIEDGGSPSSAGSHLEKRVFYSDVMNPQAHTAPSYSRMALAVLHDSGWYDADFSKATVLKWGLRAGCPFAEDYCLAAGRVVAGGDKYFCPGPPSSGPKRRCTMDRYSVGQCGVYSWSKPLPAYYQYFPDTNKVTVALARACV